MALIDLTDRLRAKNNTISNLSLEMGMSGPSSMLPGADISAGFNQLSYSIESLANVVREHLGTLIDIMAEFPDRLRAKNNTISNLSLEMGMSGPSSMLPGADISVGFNQLSYSIESLANVVREDLGTLIDIMAEFPDVLEKTMSNLTLNVQNLRSSLNFGITESFSNITRGIRKSFSSIIDSTRSSFGIVTSSLSKIRSSVTKSLSSGFKQAKNFISSPFAGIKKDLMKSINSLRSTVMSPFKAIGGFFGKLFGGSDKKIQNKILDNIIELKQINNGILKSLDGYIEYLKKGELDRLETERERNRLLEQNAEETPRRDQDQNRSGFSLDLNTLMLPFRTALGGFSIALAATLTGFDDILMSIKVLGSNTFGKILDFFKNNGFITRIFDNVKTLFSGISDFFKPIFGTVKGLFSGISDFFKPIFNLAKGLMKPLGSVLKLLKGVPFLGWFLSLFDFIGGAFKGFSETEGTLFQKILGAVEGGIMGIITGITDAFDMLIGWATYIPRQILKLIGLNKVADLIGSFSITRLVEGLWSNIKFIFRNIGDILTIGGSIVLDTFLLGFQNAANGIEEAIYNIIRFISNIPDQVYLLAQKYLNFEFPTLELPIPSWLGGGSFKLLDGFSIGVGSEEGANKARANIERRNKDYADRVTQNREESAETLSRLNENVEKFSNIGSGNAVVQNNVDGKTISSSTVVLAGDRMPKVNDSLDNLDL